MSAFRTPLLCLALTATAVAQSPLTTTFANNNGGAVGGAVYFELECLSPGGITITDLDLHTSSVGVAATIDVYLQPLAGPGTLDPSGTWQSFGNGVGMTAGVGGNSNFTLQPALPIGAGSRYGVAIVANGFGHTYTTGSAGFPLLYQTADLELLAGLASNAPFSGSYFSPRVVNTNIHYGGGGSNPGLGNVVETGDGCVGEFASFYELFDPPASADIANTQLSAINSGNGYIVVAQPGTIQPIGSLGTAQPGPTGDDSSLPIGTLGIEVFSNGQVAFGSGNSVNWVPSIATMLGNPATAIYAWTDLQPNAAGSGQIHYEESGTQYQVTYDNVYAWGTTEPSTLQIRGDVATGNFTIAFGALHMFGPENWLIGYSSAGNNADPGASDLSAASPIAPITTASGDVPALHLTATSGMALQSNVPVDIVVTTENIPATAVSHLGIVGLMRPNLPLDPFGMPGCWLQSSLDALSLAVSPASATHTWTAATIPPAAPSLAGFELNVQSAIFGTTANSAFGLGMLTTNGLQYTIGTAAPLQLNSASPLSGPFDTLVTINGSGFSSILTENDVSLGGNLTEIVSATPTQLVARFIGSPDTTPGPIEVARGTSTSHPNHTVSLFGFTSTSSNATTFTSDSEAELPSVDYTPVHPTLPPGFKLERGNATLTVDFTGVTWTPNTRFLLRTTINGKREKLKSNVSINPTGTPTMAQCLAHLAAQIEALAAAKGLPITTSVAGSSLVIVIAGGSNSSIRVVP